MKFIESAIELPKCGEKRKKKLCILEEHPKFYFFYVFYP